MDIFTLYVGQGALAAVRAGNEAVIVDAHMPDCDDITQEQIEKSLDHYLAKCNVCGLILTGLDRDHACPAGVESILSRYQPNWVMYPKYYKDTDAAGEVFDIIDRNEKRRANTLRPLVRHSVRVDRVDSRHLTGLASYFTFELFSPHMDDMDSSNNSSIVLKLVGLDQNGFSYLITGDTETERWDSINRYFGKYLASDVMAASHHGGRSGMNAKTLLWSIPIRSSSVPAWIIPMGIRMEWPCKRFKLWPSTYFAPSPKTASACLRAESATIFIRTWYSTLPLLRRRSDIG